MTLLLRDKRFDPSLNRNQAVEEAVAYGASDTLAVLLRDPRVEVDAAYRKNLTTSAYFDSGRANKLAMLLRDPRLTSTHAHEVAKIVCSLIETHAAGPFLYHFIRSRSCCEALLEKARLISRFLLVDDLDSVLSYAYYFKFPAMYSQPKPTAADSSSTSSSSEEDVPAAPPASFTPCTASTKEGLVAGMKDCVESLALPYLHEVENELKSGTIGDDALPEDLIRSAIFPNIAGFYYP